MSFPSKPTSNTKLTNKKSLTVETMEPLVLLSASHFGQELHSVSESSDHHGENNHDFDDVLVGSSGRDQFNGRGGDDFLFGRAGRDTISGGSGDDLIRGGSGNDFLKAGSGSNLVKGGSGNDTLIGGHDGSTLKGEAGNDVIVDGGEDDLIDGGFGNDVFIVKGALSEYTIRDLANNDFEIQSAAGTDVVTAVERIRFADGEYVVADLLQQINNAARVVTAPVPANPITPDSVAGKSIHGTDSSEQIAGTIGDDLIKGGLGDDVIQGNLGDDVLKGGSGKDHLTGGEGDDRLLGGTGDDTLVVGNGNDTVDGGGGFDTAVFNTVFDVVDIGNGVVRVQSIEGTDTITNVEQLSIDGTIVSLESALLFHGLPPTTDASQPAADAVATSGGAVAPQSTLTTTEIEMLNEATQTTVKRTIV